MCVCAGQAAVPGSEQPELRVWLGSLLWGNPVLQLLLWIVVWVPLLLIPSRSCDDSYTCSTPDLVPSHVMSASRCVLTGLEFQGSGWCGLSSSSWSAAAFASTGALSSASSSSAGRMRSTWLPTERLTTTLSCPFISVSISVSALQTSDGCTGFSQKKGCPS